MDSRTPAKTQGSSLLPAPPLFHVSSFIPEPETGKENDTLDAGVQPATPISPARVLSLTLSRELVGTFCVGIIDKISYGLKLFY